MSETTYPFRVVALDTEDGLSVREYRVDAKDRDDADHLYVLGKAICVNTLDPREGEPFFDVNPVEYILCTEPLALECTWLPMPPNEGL
jgi:hypothetical protein